MSVHTVILTLVLVSPDDRKANDDEVREAIESACADIAEFDVDAEASEDGSEVWTVDEATAVSIS